jgi:hypothetical protein
VQPQLDYLLKDGQTRSSALLVQALLLTDAKIQGDTQLGLIIDGLKDDIEKAKRDQDPERLAVEIQYAAELINRSQLGTLPSQAELLKAVEQPALGAPSDQVVLMGGRTIGQYAVGMFLRDAKKANLDTKNLELLDEALRLLPGPALSTQLQQMLGRTALPEGTLQATVVGEDVSKYVGSVVTGRVETKTIQYGTQKLTIAKPVIGNVFANSERAIQELAKSQVGASLTEYQGQLPAELKVHGAFRGDIAKHLEQTPLFQSHLTAASAFAQAHAKWAADKSNINNQQMVRVGIRMMKYYARQLEREEIDQAAYDAALEAMNAMFEKSGAFKEQPIGRSGEITVYAPESLSYGGVLALAWLWSKHGGEFTLRDDLDKKLREQRLRHFRVESAA